MHEHLSGLSPEWWLFLHLFHSRPDRHQPGDAERPEGLCRQRLRLLALDLGEQIYKWRQTLDGIGKANPEKKLMSGGMKFLMERPALFNTALKFAPVANHMPRFMLYNSLNAWGKGRELPTFAKESFNELWKKNKVK